MQYTKKDALIRLYHDGFPEDSNEFVEYFFNNVLDDANAVVRYNGDDMISCAHIVDKTMKYYSKVLPLPYLVAVSTLTEYRGKRMVEPVIYDAIERLDNAHMPLVALYPFKHSYYTKYGFVTVDRMPNIGKLTDIDAELVKTDDVTLLYDIYMRYEAMHDIAIHRDEDGFKARISLLDVDHATRYVIKKDGVIAGYVIAYGDNIEELVLLDNSISNIESNNYKDNVMMRVVDVVEALRSMPFDSEECTRRQIRVHDTFYKDRLVLLDIFEGETFVKYIDNPIYSIPTIDSTIEELTLYVMGRTNILGLPKIDRSKIHLIDKY